jgi:predicted RNA binding protein YcfA (HicA-like mRNA interferase family)
MSKFEKLILKILLGNSDANIDFHDICNLLENLGFERRTRGSHNIFRKEGIITKINLQKDGSKAKPYQVAQVRKIIIDNKLTDIKNV